MAHSVAATARLGVVAWTGDASVAARRYQRQAARVLWRVSADELPHPALDELGEDVDGELEADIGQKPSGVVKVALGAHANLRTSSR